jgi:hypothetical protein
LNRLSRRLGSGSGLQRVLAARQLEFRLPGKWYALGFAARDTFHVGTLKGLGRVYRQTFIDTYAKAGFAKLYDCKTPIMATIL